MSALRVGIIGPGGIALRHAQAAQTMPEAFELVVAAGRDAARTAAFADPLGMRSVTGMAALIAEKPDLVIVALPPHAHEGQVEALGRAGIHVLVEKPIALDMARARAQVEATRDVVAACGFMGRFGAAVERWDDLEAAGTTGPAGQFVGHYHCNALHADWWREREKSGGQMVEQLIHIADIARHTLGMPDTVYARASNLFHRDVPKFTSEDASAIVLGYDDGRIGVLHASDIAIPGRWLKGWQVLAQRASGVFSDYGEGKLIVHGGAPERVSDPRDLLAAQLADVAGAIRDGRPPRVPLGEGADTLQIVLAARQSADEGREVRL